MITGGQVLTLASLVNFTANYAFCRNVLNAEYLSTSTLYRPNEFAFFEIVFYAVGDHDIAPVYDKDSIHSAHI